MSNLYKDNEYVRDEIMTAWAWMGQKHSKAEWVRFIKGVTIMLANCNPEMQDACRAVLNEASIRSLLAGGTQ